MAENMSRDYANYFLKNNVEKEVTPILSTVENIQTRIAECESVFLPTIRHDNEIAAENLKEILQHKDMIDEICTQIDYLDAFVTRVKQDLQQLENQIDIATDELNIPQVSTPLNIFKSLKIFNKRPSPHATNIGDSGKYEPVDVFQSSNYFESQS